MARTKKKVQDQQRIELARYLAIQSGRGRGQRGRPRGRGSSASGSRRNHSVSTISQLTNSPPQSSLSAPTMVSGQSLPLILPSVTGTMSVIELPFQETGSTSSQSNTSLSLGVTHIEGQTAPNTISTVTRKPTARKSTSTKMKKISPVKISKAEKISCDTFSTRNKRDVGNIFDRMSGVTSNKNSLIHQPILPESKHSVNVFSSIYQAFEKLGKGNIRLPLVCLSDVLHSKQSEHSQNKNSVKTSKLKGGSESPVLVKSDLKHNIIDLNHKARKHSVNKNKQSISGLSSVTKTPSSPALPLPDSPSRSEKRKRSPNVRLGSDMILLPWHTTRKPREKPSCTKSPSGSGDNISKISKTKAGQKPDHKVNKCDTSSDNLQIKERNSEHINNTQSNTTKRKVDFTISASSTCDDDVVHNETKPQIIDIKESMQTMPHSNGDLVRLRLGDERASSRLSSLISQMSARVEAVPIPDTSNNDCLESDQESDEESPLTSPSKSEKESESIKSEVVENSQIGENLQNINNKCMDFINTSENSVNEKSALNVDSNKTKSDASDPVVKQNTGLHLFDITQDNDKYSCLMPKPQEEERTNLPRTTMQNTETSDMCDLNDRDKSDKLTIQDINNEMSIVSSSPSSDCGHSRIDTTATLLKEDKGHTLSDATAPSLVDVALSLCIDSAPEVSKDNEPSVAGDKEPSSSQLMEPYLHEVEETSLDKEFSASEEIEPRLSEIVKSIENEDKELRLSGNEKPSLHEDVELGLNENKEPSSDKESIIWEDKRPSICEDIEQSLTDSNEPNLNKDKEPSLSADREPILTEVLEPGTHFSPSLTLDPPPDDDLLYGQRTREPAPLSVLSKVEFETSPKSLSAFTSENLDSYLQSVENRKIVLSKALPKSSLPSKTSATDPSSLMTAKRSNTPVSSRTTPLAGSSITATQSNRPTIQKPLTTHTDTPRKEKIELVGDAQSNSPVNPDFDDVDGMLFVSFRCKDSMNAHINIEQQNNWDDNNFHFLDICKFHTAAKIKKDLGISGKLPKKNRESRDKEVNFRGIHMKWFKYLRLFKREMQKIKSGEKTVFRKIGVLVKEEPIEFSQSIVEPEACEVLNEALPLQQSGKLHWRTEQRLLKSLDPWDIKQMGLELKKKRRKNMIFTHRKGSSCKFEGGRVGRFGRVQRSRYEQDNEYYYGDEEKYYEEEFHVKGEKAPEKLPSTSNTQVISPKKPSLKKQLMKKYNLCSLKKLQKMWKVRVKEGRKRLIQQHERKTDGGEFPILTETMALEALTALELAGCRPLPIGEETMAEENDVIGRAEVDMKIGDQEDQALCDKPGCRYGCVCHLFSARSVTAGKGLDSDEAPGEVSVKKCEKEYCRLGCICASLERQQAEKDRHCGKPDCMFTCKCEDPSVSSVASHDISQNSSSSDELPQLQAVTETSLSPSSSDSAKDPGASGDGKATSKKLPNPPRRVGSQRVAKNLDAITRKALMYMDPEDVFPKPKRRRVRKTDQVPVINKMIPSGSLYSKMESYDSLIPDDDDIEMDYLVDSCARTTPISFSYLSRSSEQTAMQSKGDNQSTITNFSSKPAYTDVPLKPEDNDIPVISISDDETNSSLQISAAPAQSKAESSTVSQKPKQRKRKQRLEKMLSDNETTPVKNKGKAVNETVNKPVFPTPVGTNVIPTVTDYWSKNMVCLKRDNNSEDQPHLLEIMCNCSWESSRTRILSKLSRSLVSSKYPQPMEFSIDEYTISILPKASRPAKIPANLQSSFPPVMFPVRVTVSPTWFCKKEKGASGKTTTLIQTSESGQMSVSKQLRLSKDLKEGLIGNTIGDNVVVSQAESVNKVNVEEIKSPTWSKSSGISGLSNLCINKSDPSPAIQNNGKEKISTFRLQQGQVVFDNAVNSQSTKTDFKSGNSRGKTVHPKRTQKQSGDVGAGTQSRGTPIVTSTSLPVTSKGQSTLKQASSLVVSTNNLPHSSHMTLQSQTASTSCTATTVSSVPQMHLIPNADVLAKLVAVNPSAKGSLFQLYPIQPIAGSKTQTACVNSSLPVAQAGKTEPGLMGSTTLPVIHSGNKDLLSFPIMYHQAPGQTSITAKPLMFSGQPPSTLIPASAIPGGHTLVFSSLGAKIATSTGTSLTPQGLVGSTTTQSNPDLRKNNATVLQPNSSETVKSNAADLPSETLPYTESVTAVSLSTEHKTKDTTIQLPSQETKGEGATNLPVEIKINATENLKVVQSENKIENNLTLQSKESEKETSTSALSLHQESKSKECFTEVHEKDKNCVVLVSDESESEECQTGAHDKDKNCVLLVSDESESEECQTGAHDKDKNCVLLVTDESESEKCQTGAHDKDKNCVLLVTDESESEKLETLHPESEINKTVNFSHLPSVSEIKKCKNPEAISAESVKLKATDTAINEIKTTNQTSLENAQDGNSEKGTPSLMKEETKKVVNKTVVELLSEGESSLGSWSDVSMGTSSQSDKCVVIASSSEEESDAQAEYVDVEGLSDTEIEAQKHRSKRKSLMPRSNSPYMQMTFTETVVVKENISAKTEFRKGHTSRERQRRSELASDFRNLKNIVLGTHDPVAKVYILEKAVQTIKFLQSEMASSRSVLETQRSRQNNLQRRLCDLAGELAGTDSTNEDREVKEIKGKRKHCSDGSRKKMVESLTLEDGTSIQILMSDDDHSSSAGLSSSQDNHKSQKKEPVYLSDCVELHEPTSSSATEKEICERVVENGCGQTQDKVTSAIIEQNHCDRLRNITSSEPDISCIHTDSGQTTRSQSVNTDSQTLSDVDVLVGDAEVAERVEGPLVHTDIRDPVQVPLEVHSEALPVSLHTFEAGESGTVEILCDKSVSQSTLFETVPPGLTRESTIGLPTSVLHRFDEGSGIVEVNAADSILQGDSVPPELDSDLPVAVPISLDTQSSGIMEIKPGGSVVIEAADSNFIISDVCSLSDLSAV